MATTPSSEKKKKPLRERIRDLTAELAVANAKGGIRSALGHLEKRARHAVGQASEAERAELDAIAAEARTLATRTEERVDAAIEKGPRWKAKSALAQEAHPNHSDRCEDVAYRNDDQQLYIVCDGVGSNGDGDKAAQDGVDVIQRKLTALPANASIEDIRTTLRDAFLEAGSVIEAASYNTGRHPNKRAGTVGVAVKIHQGPDGKRTAVIAHNGDSRAYVRKKSGELKQLTIDHSFLQHFVEIGKLTADEVRQMNQRFARVYNPNAELDTTHVYFQAVDFRDGESKQWTERLLYDACQVVGRTITKDQEPEITLYELEDGDQLLITSDGIHDLVPDDRIESAFTLIDEADTLAQELVELSKSKLRIGPNNKTDDDRTALVIQWEDVLEAEILQEVARYRKAVSDGAALPVPYTPVAQTALRRLIESNEPGLKPLFERVYREMDEDDWRAAGAGVWIDALEADRTSTAAEEDPTEMREPEDQSMEHYLLGWRSCYFNGTAAVPVNNTENNRQAFIAFRNEMMAVGYEPRLRILVRNVTRDIPQLRNFFRSVGVEDYLTDLGDTMEPFPHEVVELTQPVQVDRTALYEVQVRRLHSQGWLRGDVRDHLDALDYVNSEAILREDPLKQNVGELVQYLANNGEQELSRERIAGLDAVRILADKLIISPDEVVDIVLTQRQLLVEAAAQRERSQRKLKTQLAKMAGYMAAGSALAASAIVSPIGVMGILAGARIIDRLVSHKLQTDKQERYVQERLAELKKPDEAEAMVAQLAARLAAVKRESLAARSHETIDPDTLRLNSERSVSRELINRSNDYLTAHTAYEADPSSANYAVLIQAQEAYLDAEQPIRRAEQALAAMMTLDQQLTQQTAALTQQSQTWLDRSPRIAALLGYKNERLAEKMTSLTFFTVAGVAAREWLPVRIALSAYAGARGGEAIATYLQTRATRPERYITAADLATIDLTNTADAEQKLVALAPAVAAARTKLADTKFKRQQPAQHEQLLTLVHQYEQLVLGIAGQQACVAMAQEQMQHIVQWAADQKTNTIKTQRRIRRLSMVLGGLMGGILGNELAQWIQERAAAAATAPEPEPSPEPTPEPEPTSEPQPTPDLTATQPPEVEAPPEPSPTSAPPVEEPPVAQPEGPAEPVPPTVTAPVEAAPVAATGKVIHEGQGLLHGLRGQVGTAEANQLLRDTKVTLDGHEVRLLDAGVTKADTLQVGVETVDGHKVITFTDAQTHQRIDPSQLGRYLYERGHTPTGVIEHGPVPEPEPELAPGPHPTMVAAEPELEPAPAHGIGPLAEADFRAPNVANEFSRDYVLAGMRDYLSDHPEYTQFNGLSDAALVERPELQWLRANLEADYRDAVQVAGTRGIEPMAEPVPPPPSHVTAANVAEYVNERGQLTAAGQRELQLGEHVSATGQPQTFADFKKDIVTILEAVHNQRVRTPNGLILENRSGTLYVDIAGGSRDAYPLDEQLYQELMSVYHDDVAKLPGREFTKALFYQALDDANAPHELHPFELDRMNLDEYFTNGQTNPYSDFSHDLRQFMSDHTIDHFTGPNGLVFKLEGDQLYVDVAGGFPRKFALNGAVYEALMEHYSRLGYDYHGKFDVDQFYKVIDAVQPVEPQP